MDIQYVLVDSSKGPDLEIEFQLVTQAAAGPWGRRMRELM